MYIRVHSMLMTVFNINKKVKNGLYNIFFYKKTSVRRFLEHKIL